MALSLFYLLASHTARFLGAMALLFGVVFLALSVLQVYTVFQLVSAELNPNTLGLTVASSVILFKLGIYLLKNYANFDEKLENYYQNLK